jgi:hypothetical protein
MLATAAPIDSLAREMKRGRPYTLGIGRVTPLSDAFARAWPSRIAGALQAKTQRKTLLIETDSPQACEKESAFDQNSSAVSKIFWTIGDDSSPSNPAQTRRAFKDLGTFPQWKEQYPLIVLHLGVLNSPAFEMLGRLCDGIALAADISRSQTTSLRDLSRTLKHHQAQGCHLLGMWSVEIG